MTKLDKRWKTIISILLFVAIFATIISVATFYDLQVSNILTKNALEDGAYLATDFFGVTGEIIGSAPVFLLIAFCATVFCLYFAKVWKLKPLNYILATLAFVVGVVAFWFFTRDIIKYILEHAGNEALKHNIAVCASEGLIAVLLNCLSVLAFRNLKVETLKKLAKFSIAAIVGVLIANLAIMFVKDPVGRMRYRAMNSTVGQDMGGFANYTRWYIANGQPSATKLKAFEIAYGVDDAFKSFPSGHTCAAGMTYAICMLPDALNIKKKGARFACWAVPITWTGLVAISRIVCGAHFMSDVTFGGTIAFLSMMIVREVFICKFSHFKAIFSKKKIASEELEESIA